MATYNPKQPRRKERVFLPGGDLWIWALRMSELCLLRQYSTRPPEDPRGGTDEEEAALWLIALSCYAGEDEDAARIWPDHQVREILEIPGQDAETLIAAINRLNGKDPTAEEMARLFTEAGWGANSSPSSTGVSSDSTASPANSTPTCLTQS